jgi:Xaa-Pro aminopeptidase
VLPVDGEPCLIVQDGRRLEAGRLSWVPDVRTYARLSRVPVEMLVDLLRERGLEAGRIGVEDGYEMTPGYAARELDAVIGALPRVAFVDGADALWAARLVKSARELECLRRACAITTAAFARCLPALRPGMTEGDAARLFSTAQIAAGGDQPRVTVTSGAGSYGLASKPPGPRRLEAGDLVWFDVGCSVRGYQSDFSRAAVLGPVSDARRRSQAVVNAAAEAGIRLIRPGVPVGEIARACYRVLDAGALPVLVEISRLGGRAGHGLGLSALEPPSVSTEDPTVLAAGMVVTVEPGVATAEGIFHHEHDVIVTDEGTEVISGAPLELPEVVP